MKPLGIAHNGLEALKGNLYPITTSEYRNTVT